MTRIKMEKGNWSDKGSLPNLGTLLLMFDKSSPDQVLWVLIMYFVGVVHYQIQM